MFDLLCDFSTGVDQVGDEPVIYIEDAFVLGPIAHIVALRQDPPNLWPQAERIRQHLKDDVPLG